MEHRRAEALELIEVLQEPRLAGDLRNAYDGIRSAGKTIADVRAMPNPGRPGQPARGGRASAGNRRELAAANASPPDTGQCVTRMGGAAG